MLRKLRDVWKDWWPFLSGAPIALYTAFAYFSSAKSELFLVARLFRFELLFLLVLLGALGLAHLLAGKESLLRPTSAASLAASSLRDLGKGDAGKAGRASAALLLLALVAFIGVVGHDLYAIYGFLHARYHHVERQAMVAEAGRLEEDQNLARAIARYNQVLERFPYNRFNANIEEKIAELSERQAHWKAEAVKIRKFEARWGEGKASTRFDQLLVSCRYVSNAEPCTRIGDYLVPVHKAAGLAARAGASCHAVLSATPRGQWWIFLDPNDALWLALKDASPAQICEALGLGTGEDVGAYLDLRWYLPDLEQQREMHPRAWSVASAGYGPEAAERS